MNEIISVKQLSKSYGGLTAVQSLDLSVMQGTVFGLFIAASSYVPPVDIKMAALNNQNRRWKERLDMGNRPAQQRFFFSAAGQIIYFSHPSYQNGIFKITFAPPVLLEFSKTSSPLCCSIMDFAIYRPIPKCSFELRL